MPITDIVDGKKFAVIEKYILVFLLIVLGYAITVLFSAKNELEGEYRKVLIDQISKSNLIMQDVENELKLLRRDLPK